MKHCLFHIFLCVVANEVQGLSWFALLALAYLQYFLSIAMRVACSTAPASVRRSTCRQLLSTWDSPLFSWFARFYWSDNFVPTTKPACIMFQESQHIEYILKHFLWEPLCRRCCCKRIKWHINRKWLPYGAVWQMTMLKVAVVCAADLRFIGNNSLL